MFTINQKVTVSTKPATVVSVETKGKKTLITVRFADGSEQKRPSNFVEALPEFLPPQTAAEFFADGEAIKLIRRASRPGGSLV